MLPDGHTFGLMLNVDWFNPYKHTQYSVGALYFKVNSCSVDPQKNRCNSNFSVDFEISNFTLLSAAPPLFSYAYKRRTSYS